MTLNNDDIERIAELIFKKLLAHQKDYEEESIEQIYQVHDEFGNISTVNEKIFLEYELDRLSYLEDKYANEEEFEKASIIKNKINKIKLKIKKL